MFYISCVTNVSKYANLFSSSFGAHFRFERQNAAEPSGIKWRNFNGVAGSGNEPERKILLQRTVSVLFFID